MFFNSNEFSKPRKLKKSKLREPFAICLLNRAANWANKPSIYAKLFVLYSR